MSGDGAGSPAPAGIDPSRARASCPGSRFPRTRGDRPGPTARTVEVPEGIDPGWAYAPGQGQRSGAELLSPAEYTLAGREIRGEIESAVKAGGIQPTNRRYPAAVRMEIRRRLDAERGAGTVAARVSGAGRAGVDVQAAGVVRHAASAFPRTWIERANKVRVSVQHLPPGAGVLGDYYRATSAPSNLVTPGRPNYPVRAGHAVIRTEPTRGAATHEYTHHLQDTMPELDALFRRVHVRRTTRPDGSRDPVLPLEGYRGSPGRKDRYIDGYFGREYPGPGWPSGPLEVMTRTYETIFSPAVGGSPRTVRALMDNDPELLDFAIGALFRYDPL